jgi:hypothetical protein
LNSAFGPFDSLKAAKTALQFAENFRFGIYFSSSHPGTFKPFLLIAIHGAPLLVELIQHNELSPYILP